jgi:hypothetical protein
MKDYVVRIVLPDGVHDLDPQTRLLLILMGQAGVIQVHRDDGGGTCFDLLPPAGAESKAWADKTAEAFNDFHFNAVRAPACPAEACSP